MIVITRRIAPCLLLSGRKLVKTVKFCSPKYVGDPINAVRIFNDKEVDEIVILDIDASVHERPPQFEYLKEVVSEAFVPIAYGGGIRSLSDVDRLLHIGIEKVCLNSINADGFDLITQSAHKYGSQSVVGVVDVKKNFFGKNQVYYKSSKLKAKLSIQDYVLGLQNAGAGEIFINFVDRDGTYNGYDLEIIENLCRELKVPVIVAGGAGKFDDFINAFRSGASAVCAGSLFVFHGPHRAVLINYPTRDQVEKIIL